MLVTSFWHSDGTPMSAQQFMEMLFGRLPEFFKNEAELRALWSAPDTRKKLLQGLAEKGFGGEQLAAMQKIIDAEKSDLLDVLAHVAYALTPLTREERAARAKVVISTEFNGKPWESRMRSVGFLLTFRSICIGVRSQHDRHDEDARGTDRALLVRPIGRPSRSLTPSPLLVGAAVPLAGLVP